MSVTIRHGNAGDAEVAFPLMFQRLRERSAGGAASLALAPDAERRFRQWLGTALADSRHALLVAEDDGRIIGCLAALVERDLPIYEAEEYVAVRMLWVAPDRAAEGIARQLLDRAAREYAALGLRQMRIHTAADVPDEHRAAEEAGFHAAAVVYVRGLAKARARGTAE